MSRLCEMFRGRSIKSLESCQAGQRWYPDIHHEISDHSPGQCCITSLSPELSITEIFVRNILHRNWSSPLTMSKLLPGVNDRDILWCPPSHAHSCSHRGLQRLGRGNYPLYSHSCCSHILYSQTQSEGWGRENREEDTICIWWTIKLEVCINQNFKTSLFKA